ncbi:HAMP domain-containing protein [Streptomyces eurocidicus]|uniref:histidine kinase n=1 Tax=Streptomyces eurocidicus TaxID=66423 RepID=A0A7W8F112_STREU|nr:nitrate- and nitrite sensing domain-containing protein [Streptomyces eurocidicus]MBB5116761.1 signal transduction histidine kinase [Streptomyces eurocidicus]MBF6052237.1 HAMP domain-containing protein [Streptomyces eurocidicus]
MQGRFKRDGSAAAEPEPRGATDRGTSADAPTGGESAERPKSKSKANRTKSPNGPGARIALRNWRISTRLVSLLALPVVAATTLGALRIDSSLENIDQLDHMKLLTEMTGRATALASALQEERDRSAGPLAAGNGDSDDRVVATRQKSDREIKAFTEATKGVKPTDTTMVGVQTTLVDISRQLRKIDEVRKDAYQDRDYIARTVNNYDGLINSLLSLSQDMAQATSSSEMITSTRALATFSAAKEYASIQRAVITAALAAKGGPRLSSNDSQYGKEALDAETEAIKRFTAIRSVDAKQLMLSLNGGISDVTSANTFADRVFSKSDGLKTDAPSWMDWSDQSTVKLNEMSKIEQTLLSQMDQKARELRDEAQQEAILNGVLIILVLGISLVGAFVVARSMVRSLHRLQRTAQRVAQERLPELVKQLSETDPQDVDTTVESVGVHSRDEIGKVAAAFDDVHREAVRLAAEQALLRGNVNAMFTNLSRRSQGLIQRQLSLISELESREADPDQLSSLFRLDHLATRMRRNGENLLVLAGEEPGRRWTRPVPLVDVLRAAASEVEQYERIELSGVPPTEVAGRVVNDLVHLLAELLENATSFSSPQTKVKVTGHALPDGRVLVEIHDTGIGLSPEDLAAINERLASPPTVDVSVSRRMGLFVVGRLSLRHGIRIQLRPSDSGGTTALVMLPVDVAQGGKRPMPGAAGAPAMGGGAPQGGMPGGLAGGLSGGMPGAKSSGPGGNAGLMSGGSTPRRPAAPASGPRPALPGRPGMTEAGLPTRPAPAARPEPGAGAAGSLFDAPPRGAADAKGAPGADGRPSLPTRGNGGPAAVPPPSEGVRRPKMPKRRGNGPASEMAGRPAASWGNQQPPAAPKAPADDWPAADPAPRAAQDVPRGHEEPETTGGFARPAEAPRGGGDTAQFPALPASPEPEPRSSTSGEYARPAATGGTGQFELPSGSTGRFARPDGPGDTGQFAQPNSSTGQFARPDGPGDTGQFAQPNSTTGQFVQPDGPGDTGQFAQPNSTTGQFARPDGPGDTGQFAQPNSTTGQFAQPGAAETTGRFALPSGDTGQFARPDGPGDTGQFARPEATPQAPADDWPTADAAPREPRQTRGGAGRFALPEGQAGQNGRTGRAQPPAGDARTPLFDEMESHWFRGAAGEGQAAAPEQPAGMPQRLPRRGESRQPLGNAQTPQTPEAAPAPQGAQDNWRDSPNDERWRRAEQVREPAAGGTTSSGLPRRVPRANLVDGTAEQQQSTPVGPQVSRAPDDVRGRLTNLRRGIQQGRQAGNTSTGSHNLGPTYPQER